MDVAGYTTLTRQAGLLREIDMVAQNIANVATDGYRRQGLAFSEHIAALGREEPSVSMAHADVRLPDLSQGPLTQTGGAFDFAIEGPGFFQLDTADGLRLTRAGSFTPDAGGELVAPDGARLLDLGGAPVFIPPDARDIALARDGTLSVDGVPLAQLGLSVPQDPTTMVRDGSARFEAGALAPVPAPVLIQGFVEGANVDPVAEVARMIEVQHAYQMGQSFLDREDERIRAVIRTLSR